MDSKALKLTLSAERNRLRLMEIIRSAHAGHTGGDLSCLNMLTVLYERYLRIDKDHLDDPDRDRFILSKGHCVEALYSVLESRGILPKELVDSLGHFASPLAGHPLHEIPGIEINSGALGHGLSVGIGMALAARMDSRSYRTVVLMGDGEQAEGSIYEAAMAASHYRLGNLIAIIDRNMLQISGCTEDVMALENMRDRWTAFGWEVVETDGNDPSAILETLNAIDTASQRPHLVISHTTKGYGVSFMEGVAKWHHGVPDDAQYAQAREEIGQRIKELEEKLR